MPEVWAWIASLIWALWPAYVFVNQATHNDPTENKDKQNHRGEAKKLEHLTSSAGRHYCDLH